MNQGSSTGQLAQRLDDFSRSMPHSSPTSVTEWTMSHHDDVRVRRMARETKSWHRSRPCRRVIRDRGHVKGGKVHGKWPASSRNNSTRDVTSRSRRTSVSIRGRYGSSRSSRPRRIFRLCSIAARFSRSGLASDRSCLGRGANSAWRSHHRRGGEHAHDLQSSPYGRRGLRRGVVRGAA